LLTWYIYLVYGVHVNGADQGDGRNRYIRSPPNNNPVKDVRSDAIACNVNGGSAVGSFVSVAAGDRVTFEWYHNK
jgi:cellulase